MKKFCSAFIVLLLSCDIFNVKNSESGAFYYPVEVVDYVQAPGYFSNNNSYSIKGNIKKVLGFPNGAGEGAGNIDSIVSLGEAGGYITVKFDPPIKNSFVDSGWDFIVYGNTFYVGANPLNPTMEPGFVEVSADGINWYLLVPNEYRSNITNRSITYNKSDYSELTWPEDEISDSMFLNSWESSDYTTKLGFCEISPTQIKDESQSNVDFYANKDLRGGGDPFKIEWAVDSSFNTVLLDEISYIRITTGVYTGGDFTSQTEVDAVIRIHYEDE